VSERPPSNLRHLDKARGAALGHAPHLMTPQQYSLCSISSRTAGLAAKRERPEERGERFMPPLPPGGGGGSAAKGLSPMPGPHWNQRLGECTMANVVCREPVG